MTISSNAACSELLHRAWPASSRLRSAIFCRSIDLARLILGARQPKDRPDCLGLAEASGDVDGGAIGQRHHGPDTRGRHQAPAHLILPDNGQQAAMQDDDLLPK